MNYYHIVSDQKIWAKKIDRGEIMYKSGFITVIGRANVGKSTLLNNIIGEKISIISDKPQTTRNKIQCVYTEKDHQVVFLDTPGIQKPKNQLGKYMLKTSKSTLEEVDLITVMVDESLRIGPIDNYIFEVVKYVETPKILLINKIDKLKDEEIVKLIELYNELKIFEEIIPVSAVENINIDKYLSVIKEYLPEGPQYFPEDMVTDQPQNFIIAEIIREKALLYLKEEIPHGIFVAIDSVEKREEQDIIDVHGTIYCEKNSHKGIIIGKRGRMLKKIGIDARKDLEGLLGSKINLQLWVKIEKNWRDKKNKLKYFGYQ